VFFVVDWHNVPGMTYRASDFGHCYNSTDNKDTASLFRSIYGIDRAYCAAATAATQWHSLDFLATEVLCVVTDSIGAVGTFTPVLFKVLGREYSFAPVILWSCIIQRKYVLLQPANSSASATFLPYLEYRQ